MREKIDQGLERQTHADILSSLSPRGWVHRVRRLWSLALGFVTFAGLGCEPHLGEAKFCHNLTVDGQPAVLQLVQLIPGGGERSFTAVTGDCSPCSRLKLDNTFKFELREQSGNVLYSRYLFLPSGYRTYLMSIISNPDETLRFSAQNYPGSVSCKSIPDPVIEGDTSSLMLEDGEGDEEPASVVPDDSSETPQN
jgi:hypothetical protein